MFSKQTFGTASVLNAERESFVQPKNCLDANIDWFSSAEELKAEDIVEFIGQLENDYSIDSNNQNAAILANDGNIFLF